MITDYIGLKCYYIGYREDLGRRVLFEGIIVEDLGNEFKCEMIDRFIHISDDKFFVNFTKKELSLSK